MTTAEATAAPSLRVPAAVRVVTGLLVLMPLVTAYGALYFTYLYDGASDPGPLAALFVAGFWAIAATALAAGVGLYRGSRRAQRVILGYCVLMTLWTIAKLVFWHETESLVFGVVTFVVAGLALAPSTRRYLDARSR